VKLISDTLRLSATDLANYLGCKRLTQLNRSVAFGEISKPDWLDPAVAILPNGEKNTRQHMWNI
jgi:hypothetical protein